MNDLEAAESWIARDNPDAAAELVLRIVKTVSLLQVQPGIGRPGRVPGTRELVVPETMFVIPYQVREDVVVILRVYHSARKWPERL